MSRPVHESLLNLRANEKKNLARNGNFTGDPVIGVLLGLGFARRCSSNVAFGASMV